MLLPPIYFVAEATTWCFSTLAILRCMNFNFQIWELTKSTHLKVAKIEKQDVCVFQHREAIATFQNLLRYLPRLSPTLQETLVVEKVEEKQTERETSIPLLDTRIKLAWFLSP